MSLAPPTPPALARIAAIQARFEPTAATPLGSSAQGSAALGSSTSDFQSVLDALSGSDSTDGTDRSGTALNSILGTTGLNGTSPASSGTPTGADVVSAGVKYLGVPYKWGGTDPATGLDCSGFVQRAYGDVGITLPRVSRDQAKVGTEVPSLDQAKPGDLIAFGQPVDHIAIYAGNGKMVQAPHTGAVVSITPVRRDIATIRRVIPSGSSNGVVDLTTAPASSVVSSSTGTSSPGTLAANTPYRDLFLAAGQKYGLDPRLLAAVGKVESNFNSSATSPVGATGLMQFMPSTAAGMGIDPSDPAQAIDGAGRYLSTQLNRFGSIDLALAAYNAGPRAVERAGGIPPYPETRSYVVKVQNAMNQVSA